MNFNKKVFLLIILSSLIRFWVAGSLELGNDEVYYQTYALHLQWNYFDHPPLLAFLIRLSTLNLFFHHEFFIRLGSMLCAAFGTWLIYIIGARISSPRAGWFAAILYNTSFYSSIIAGCFILPDSPQVIFWLLSLYFMLCLLEDKETQSKTAMHFILLGICIGLCIMSKVHGIFLSLGFGAYIIFHRRDFLKKPMLWVSGLISLLIISPIYLWNLQNHFITYTYHQGRMRFLGMDPDMDHLLQQVLGSVFYSNPVNFILYVCALFALMKGKIKKPPSFYPLLIWLSIPLIAVLLWTSLFNETLPHWSGPAYFSMMLLAGSWLDEKTNRLTVSRWLKSSGALYASVLLLGIFAICCLPFRIGIQDEIKTGKGDITLDMSGWKTFAQQMDSLYQTDLASGKMRPDATLISDYWFPAGHLDHYFAVPYGHNLLAVGPLNDIHHFAWLNQRRPRLKEGEDAYFIYSSNYYGPPSTDLRNTFRQVDDSVRIPQYRSGKLVRWFVIYRMHDFRGDSSVYLLPGIH